MRTSHQSLTPVRLKSTQARANRVSTLAGLLGILLVVAHAHSGVDEAT